MEKFTVPHTENLYWDMPGVPGFDMRCERVLGLGDIGDLHGVFGEYGHDAVRGWLAANPGRLDRKSEHFWRLYFELPEIPLKKK